MKKSVFLLVIIWFAVSSVSVGQNMNGCDKSKMKSKTEKCPLAELNLSEAQKTQVKAIKDEFRAKDSVLFAEFKLKQKELRSAQQQSLSTVLTKEQLTMLDSMKPHHKAKMEPGMMPFRGGHQKAHKQAHKQGGPGLEQAAGCENGPCCKQVQDGMEGQHAPMMGMKNHKGKQMHRPFAENNKQMAAPVNPEERIKMKVEKMTKELNLSQEQAEKITQIHRKYAKKEIERYQKFKKQQDAKLKKQTSKQDEIKAVLTSEQIKKLDAMKEKQDQKQTERSKPEMK
jgi:hypothetical protein